ncbi:flagellar sheath protein A [Vibrio rotiferianus]|uniref:flagellar sheath protein A n=1 Tax=Vibrio rotiferianus TaxID=190895 RepID=UPI00148D219D|nr:flagellar sheath protein A [Vibrio rotiferianus]NOH67392.1 flagellar sheath protein A [Vibrio rotiferianus]
MKQLKVLPLVAIISGLMVGCGGGGGGGGSAPVITNYTFTFVAPKVQDLDKNANCTIFDRFEENGVDRVLNYNTLNGALDNALVAFYSDASGKRVGDIIRASNDKLVVTLESIPQGGSVTLQEQSHSIINAVTFSKDLLAADSSLRNVYLSANSIVSNTTCLLNNNYVPVNKNALDYKQANDASGNPYSTFYFDSQLDTVEANESRFTKGEVLPAISGEVTMIAQYRTQERSGLYQYGFEDWPESRMVFTGKTSTPLVSGSGINFSKIDIDAVYRNYSYRLAEISKSDSFYHPAVLNGDIWTFSVTGGIDTNGWQASYNDKVSEQWDIIVDDASLFALNNTQDVKPSVSGNEVALTDSIALNNEEGLQRFSYQQGATVGSTPYVLRHSVYSLIAGDLLVPDLELSNIPVEAAKELVVSNDSTMTQGYAFSEQANDLQVADFMTAYSHGDGADTRLDVMGIVKNEIQAHDAAIRVSQIKNLFLERTN